VAIGVVALTEASLAIVAIVFVFIGAGLMLEASVLLILESRIGLSSTYAEMDFLWKRGLHSSPEVRENRSLWRFLGS